MVGSLNCWASAAKVTVQDPAGRLAAPLQVPLTAEPLTRASGTVAPGTEAVTLSAGSLPKLR
jgi:hypothetical protein